MDYWFSAIFPSGESLPGNMGMNGRLGKSNCHSSFPCFRGPSPSLQTDDRSKLLPFPPLFFHHPSSLNHLMFSHIFIQQISPSGSLSSHLCPSSPIICTLVDSSGLGAISFFFSAFSSLVVLPSNKVMDFFPPSSFPFPPLFVSPCPNVQQSVQSINRPLLFIHPETPVSYLSQPISTPHLSPLLFITSAQSYSSFPLCLWHFFGRSCFLCDAVMDIFWLVLKPSLATPFLTLSGPYEG